MYSCIEIGTLLHSAARSGKVDVAHYLIQNGVDPSTEDTRGQTALDYAHRYNHPEMLELLKF